MNLFYLDTDPVAAARYHCDKHILKMIIEYGQMTSTAHRILDGHEYIDDSTGRKIRRWSHLDDKLYKATHVNHPSNIWVRDTSENYQWTLELFAACCDEYKRRYGKVHQTWEKLALSIHKPPANITRGSMNDIPLCMPDKYKVDCPVESYRNFYRGDKRAFAKWKNTDTPWWFNG
jgi:hypothetical protein